MRFASLLSTLGTSSLFSASAAITIDASLFQGANHFGSAGVSSYAFFNVFSDEPDLLSLDISSPSGSIRGSTGGADSANFPSFQALLDEVQAGPWTMTLVRDAGGVEPVSSIYQFGVDLSGVATPGSFTIQNPVNGATGVSTGLAAIQWTPPTEAYTSQGVSLTLGSSSRPTIATDPIGPTDSEWPLGAPGLTASTTYFFFAQYTQDLTGAAGVSMSTPTDDMSNALADFSYTVQLHNEANSIFTTVPEPRYWAVISGVGLAAFALARRRRGIK